MLLVGDDHLAISNWLRTIFEIFLAISASLLSWISIQPATKLHWLFFGVACFSSILFLGLSVSYSRLARSGRSEAKLEGVQRIIAQAKTWRLSAEDSNRNVREQNIDDASAAFSVTATAEEWGTAFLDWVHADRPHHPPLSDQAISREGIYREREDAQL